MKVFDLTDARSDDSANHNKFVNSPELVRLVGSRLALGQTLSDGRISLGDKVLGVVANELGAVETSVEKAETPEDDAAVAK